MDTSSIITITVAIGGGLGVLAITLPQAYKQLAKALLALIFLTYFATGAWGMGLSTAMGTLRPFIEASKLAEAEKALEHFTPSVLVASLCFWGAIAYIWLLDWIASHAIRARGSSTANS